MAPFHDSSLQFGPAAENLTGIPGSETEMTHVTGATRPFGH